MKLHTAHLDLDPFFCPGKSQGTPLLIYDYSVFPGGEPQLVLSPYSRDIIKDLRLIKITHRITSADALLKLYAALNTLRESLNYRGDIELITPYFPGARQDRISFEGSPFTAIMYADIINKMGFSKVTILDPHSDVVPALINNREVLGIEKYVARIILSINPDADENAVGFIAPDIGASKKVEALSLRFNVPFLQGFKHRDPITNELSGFSLGDNWTVLNKVPNWVIIDDICDGGGTFIGLAKSIKMLHNSKLYLYTTHGIYSKGFTELNKHFDGIFTTDSFQSIDDPKVSLKYDDELHKVTQFKITI